MKVLEFYKDFLDEFSIVGKVLLFPLFLLIFPFVVLISICMKD
jgi:hypothetical protein